LSVSRDLFTAIVRLEKGLGQEVREVVLASHHSRLIVPPLVIIFRASYALERM